MTRFDRLTRYGQVNFTAADVEFNDSEYWRDIWCRAKVQVVALNAGGAVAYYPTDLKDQPRLPGVGVRDPFGEMVAVARELGIEVIARLDLGVVDQTFRDLHPEWIMTDAAGRSRSLHDVTGRPWGRPGSPPIENELYYTCINSKLFSEFVPALLSEIAERYDVAGFFTNGFPTLALVPPSTRLACYCAACLELWTDFSGGIEYPNGDDPRDPAFRTYVAFLQHRTLEVVRGIQSHTTGLPGGLTFMTSSIPSFAGGLPWSRWTEVVEVLYTDNQDRVLDYGRQSPPPGLWEMGFSASLTKSVSRGLPSVRCVGAYRLRQGRHSSKDPAELALQLAVPFAHGERPLWHSVSGRQWSRRWTEAAVDFDRWLAASGADLSTLASDARVGVAWSQQSAWHEEWERSPERESHYDAAAGWYAALQRAGVPVDLVNGEILDRLEDLELLILPTGFSAGAETIEWIAQFVQDGGALIAAGDAGLRDEWGDPHPTDVVGNLIGIERGEVNGPSYLTYLRRTGAGGEAAFMLSPEDDELIPGGRWYTKFEATDAATAFVINHQEFVIPTFAASLPPAESAPAIAIGAAPASTAYLATDLDVAYFRQRSSDQLALLRGLVDTVLVDRRLPVRVQGNVHMDVHAWRSGDALFVSLVNLNHPSAIGSAVEDLHPVHDVRLSVNGFGAGGRVELLREDCGFDWEESDAASGDIVIHRIRDFEVVRFTSAPVDG